MSEGYQIRNQEAIHYLTFQVINWMCSQEKVTEIFLLKV
jgi:hypothetical protein